jgi:hypothetical protein
MALGMTLDFGDWKREPRVAGVGTPPPEELALDPRPRDLQNRKPRPMDLDGESRGFRVVLSWYSTLEMTQ